MDEQKIRQIVRDEIQRNYRSGSPMIPPHQHNDNDNLTIGLQNIIGTNAVPYAAEKISNAFFGPDYGYASPTILSPKRQYILNNFVGVTGSAGSTSLASLFTGSTLQSTVPIPVIIAPQDGVFQGGMGDLGTIVAFQRIDFSVTQLWILLINGWYSIDLV